MWASSNPYNVPLAAAGSDYWGTSAPNSAFAFANGDAIDRITYATLFAIIRQRPMAAEMAAPRSILPDKTGRVSAMKESSVARLNVSHSLGELRQALGRLEAQKVTR